MAAALDNIIRQFQDANRTVPLVGKTQRTPEELESLLSTTSSVPNDLMRDSMPGDFTALWGRLNLDQVIRYFIQSYDTSESSEFFDLGTPVHALGSGSANDNQCSILLALSDNLQDTDPRNKVGAAIVDLGDEELGKNPDDYNGKLHHAVTNNIKLSDHAEKVLLVLLSRLQKNGDLTAAKISCALVKPPAQFVGTGLSAFDQACSPEMLTAIMALEAKLSADGLPAVINLSLGTHVGPHNGDSPLEQYIATKLIDKDRHLVAAAGNDGGAGRSTKCTLEADEPEFLNIKTGPLCKQLLVEFWWEDPVDLVQMSLEVDICETVISGAVVITTNHATLTIDSNTAGMLAIAQAGLPSSMIMQSLFSGRCQNGFRCAAFAISATSDATMPILQLAMRLLAKQQVTVNSWIVVAEADPLTGSTAFVEGGAVGNVTVPASDPAVLSVAGLDASGKVWRRSSRGPAAEYDTAAPRIESPVMAHLSDLGSDFGTSFASPRACADAVGTMTDKIKQKKCVSVHALLSQTYNLPATLKVWSPRIGFHKQTT
jgi:hypothetical protein